MLRLIRPNWNWSQEGRRCEYDYSICPIPLLLGMVGRLAPDLPKGYVAVASRPRFTTSRASATWREGAVNNQDEPYEYLARPYWERDDVKVFADLESLITRCDDGQTFGGPGSVQVTAVFRDGREVKVPREAYSVPDLVSKAKAKDFIRWRSDPDAPSISRGFCGLFRANPDLPFEEQVAQYIETSPWRWKTSEELASSDAVSHGGKAL